MDETPTSGPEAPRPAPGDARPIGRRAFLGVVAAGVAGIAVAPWLARTVGDRVGDLLPDRIDGVLPGGDGWRIYSIATPFPRFDPSRYTLTVSGAVALPARLSWDQVAALPAEEQVSDFHCVTGWSVEDVRWRGIRARTLVDLVRPLPGARHVTFVSMEEPYADGLTLEQFLLPDVMLALGMDGAPLSREHGAPLRLVVPRMYGYKGVKWLREIRFDTEPGIGYWEARGYDADAWVGDSNGL